MGYYLRSVSDPVGPSPEVWTINDNVAQRVDVSDADLSFFRANRGETIWEALQRQTSWFGPNAESPFHKLVLEPGQYHPRIARPMHFSPGGKPKNPAMPRELDYVAVAYGQLAALTAQLVRICQTVQPEESTFDVFGHDIRNLLILACTEVESHWRGVLVANQFSQPRFTTNHYVLLKEAMRLDEYAVTFPIYPWLAPMKPFEGWDSVRPTATLKWYGAYNAVKHNREKEFNRATLRHAFEAVAACAIMIAAQYGPELDTAGRRPELRTLFFTALPVWPLTHVYVYLHRPEGWSPVPFDFNQPKSRLL